MTIFIIAGTISHVFKGKTVYKNSLWFLLNADLSESGDQVEKYVPCPICIRNMSSCEESSGRDIFTACHIFPYKELVIAATIKGLDHVICERYTFLVAFEYRISNRAK